MVPEGWKHQEIGDWLVEFRTKSAVQDEHPVMTSSRNGIVLQSDYYGDGRITQRENIGFHVLPPGFITYRSRSDDGLFFFNMNALGTTGLVSHFYPVFHFPAGSTGFFLDLLNTYREVFSAHAVGSSQVVLSLNALKKVRLPIPPAREQQKIAEILGTWDKAIETTEALLANARTQKRALMQSLLTGTRRFPGFEDHPWREVRLGDVAKVDRNSLGSKTPDNYEFEYISLTNVEPGHIVEPLTRMTFGEAPSRARRLVAVGDILMSTVRPNLQGFAQITPRFADCVASTGFAVISPGGNVSGSYLFHYLFSDLMTTQLDALVVGSNYPAINSSDVKQLTINLPVLDEQNRIGVMLDDSDKDIRQLEKEADHLRTEKKSLMQQLLTGKRRVVV